MGVVVSGLIVATASAGGIYKWVDAGGVTHYGNQPSGRRAKKVDLDEYRKVQQSLPGAGPSGLKDERADALSKRLQRAQATGRSADLDLERREAARKRAAAAPPKPDPSEAWRGRAVASCESGGLRQNCDSEEQTQKRRPLTESRRQKREEKRIRRLKNEEAERRRNRH